MFFGQVVFGLVQCGGVYFEVCIVDVQCLGDYLVYVVGIDFGDGGVLVFVLEFVLDNDRNFCFYEGVGKCVK